jgi:hypothetical protein
MGALVIFHTFLFELVMGMLYNDLSFAMVDIGRPHKLTGGDTP